MDRPTQPHIHGQTDVKYEINNLDYWLPFNCSNLNILLPDLEDDIAEGYNGPGDIFISETGL